MLFKPRTPPSFIGRVRVALWPRRSWARSIRYVALRLKRLPTSPHRIAVGFAAGVFAVFTPFLGLQIILSAVLAWMLRGNVLASIMGSLVGNPLTYPAIWVATYSLGTMLIGGPATFHLTDLQNRAEDLTLALGGASPNAVAAAFRNLWTYIKPMAAGCLPIGGLAAVLAYTGVRRFVSLARAV